MSIRVDGIQSEDELQKAQASAQAQGTTVTDYNEWSQILKEFAENGIQSTGSFAGDKAIMKQIEELAEEYVTEIQNQQQVQKEQPQNNDTQKVQKASETDKDQQLKATVANGMSSEIMANYMKAYFLI